ncbi:hypothetical protein A9Q99_02065 [Gammaproteobacteria bacterium 45_16_T64]|nr:hypothetical protein A9Q99_02065 [Gammaproteobacteria bacterium 45_16_T64]
MNKELEQSIIQHIASELGSDYFRSRLRRSGEGGISETWELYGVNTPSLFIKIGRQGFEQMYASECVCLEELQRAKKFRVPKPMLCGVIEGQCAFLAMEFIQLTSLRRSSEVALGEALAEMHSIESDRFGFAEDNYIGRSMQPNGWSLNWWSFFAENRLQHQLSMAINSGLRSDLVEPIQLVIQKAPVYFVTHKPKPTLLHGDLWSGNVSADSQGRPVIYDPAVYYGDAETDVAMSQMFGALGQAVYDAYYANIDAQDGIALRRPVYDLYHWLNHFNLFGISYLGQVERVIKQLSDTLV